MDSKIVDTFWHQHRLYEYTGLIYNQCQVCHRQIGDSRTPMPFLACFRCRMSWHPSCVPSSEENISHPCHPNHPLELLPQGPPNYSDGKCSLCRRKLSNNIYHCKLCDFSVDASCANNPPPLTVDHPKCHEHALTLMGRNVSFACNACGTHGERNPYVCLPCSLMFHYTCLDLPHVININRHDHRMSHVSRVSPGNWVCEICRQDINWRYGAYSCNKCPSFFVHSRCATRKDVWDGIELEGIPEEEVDVAPFKVIEEGVINHFSHEEHNLFLFEDVFIDGAEDIHCEACARPISFEKHYNCMECKFMLHEQCANLPLQKRHGLSTSILSLSLGKDEDDDDAEMFVCVACERGGSGFRYKDGEGLILDVHCASLSWFRHRKIHPHTLFLTTLDRGTCLACDKRSNYLLSCVECEYHLDFKCATLPVVIKHKCDAHFLFLRSREKASGKYWCEICETETNPEKWFYTCDDCGVVCHIDCVVGDSLNIKPGFRCIAGGMKLEAILNDHNSRPKCFGCGSRCRFPMVYKASGNNIEGYFCALLCISKHMGTRLVSYLKTQLNQLERR